MEIIKAKNDNRKYEHFILDNQMQVLLIHDPLTTTNAASMCVGVGFYQDSPEYYGLAHFLEHMLFMGTAKYPQVNHFMSFLNTIGGSTNAYTTGDITNYYFDCPSNKFKQGINIFGQFFIAPLFAPDTIEKEINAVNAEHSKNYNIDGWRLNRMLREVSDKNHPYYNFGCGNKKTLLKDDIRDRLIEFYNKYYSSNLMKLVVYTSDDIFILRKLITKIFSQVVNKDVMLSTDQEKDKNVVIFPTLPVTIEMVPINDVDILNVYWPNIQTDPTHYQYKPLKYISNILSHEAYGSLAHNLKKLNYINNLTAGIEESDKYLNMLYLSLHLTSNGIEHKNKIITIVYNFVDLIKKVGVNEWQYNEYQKASRLYFDYSPKLSPSDYVEEVSVAMNKYGIKHVLIANNYYKKYSSRASKLIQDMLNLMTPTNAIYIICSRSFVAKTNRVEKWYNINYNIYRDTWFYPDTDKSNDTQLMMPRKNKLIPDSIKIYPNNYISEYPQATMTTTNNVNVWFKQDSLYGISNILTSIILYNSQIYSSSKNYLSFLLFNILLDDKMEYLSSYSSLANNSFSITTHKNYITIDIVSYNDTTQYLLKKIVNTMLNLQFTQAEFTNAKNILSRHLANFVYKPLTIVAGAYLKEKVNKLHFSNTTLLNSIDSIVFADVKKINEQLRLRCYAQCLIQGNCTKEIIPIVVNAIEPFIGVRNELPVAADIGVCPTEINKPHATLPLCNGQEEVYLSKSFNPNETNSYIGIFFEIGNKHNTYITDWDFKFSKLLILNELINEQFFHQLRSIEQSGYIVMCKLKNIGTKRDPLFGMNFMIQSAKKSPHILKNRIKKFIKQFKGIIDDMSNETYEQYVMACNHTLTSPYNNIFEEVEGNIQNIIKCKNFDYKKRLSKIVKSVSKDDVVKFYEKYFINKKTKRVRTVQIYGKHDFTA